MIKTSKKMGSLRQLLPYVWPHKGKLMAMLLCVLISNMAFLYIPGQIGVVLDKILEKSEGVALIILYMLGAAIIAWVFSALQNSLAVVVGQSVISALRQDLFAHLSHLPVSYYDGMTKGNLMSIMVTDTSNLSDTISTDLITLASGAVTLIGASVMMLSSSAKMSSVFLLTVPMMIAVSYYLISRARRLHQIRKAAYGKLCGYAEEMLTAQKSLFVYGQEENTAAQFEALSKDQRKKATHAEYYSCLVMPVLNGVSNLNYILLAAVGTSLVLAGSATVGDITSFVLYSKKFASPISDASNIIGMLQSALAACDRIFAVLNTPIEQTTSIAEQSTTQNNPTNIATVAADAPLGKVEFSHVSFGYTPTTPILKDIDFTVLPGQKIAIVGATGAGKTTLISLLLRFYKATDGVIRIEDRPIESIPLGSLRRRFAMVLQDVWLFDGTVYDNITYAMPAQHRARETVRALCREIGVEEMIEQLPGGYDCYLRNDSNVLSQGQKQLLSITRAFLCNPDVFILDEATSSIDPQTEHKIQAVTNRVLQGKSSIVIAHRLSTILSADSILVLQDGYVAEQGNHVALMQQDGLYRQIFESQFTS